jgi:chaperonin cofactor prefoldin
MNLAIRDHKIIQLKAELENRKKILCMKRHQLKHNIKENVLLKEVADDYNNYNNHIISQKEKQIVFLQMLNEYIDNINDDLMITSNKLKNSQQDQREIMKEISVLKNELDDLVNPNNNNNNLNNTNNNNNNPNNIHE